MSCPQSRQDQLEDDRQPGSQDLEARDMWKATNEVIASGKKRREKKRKEIESQHEKRVKELGAKIDNLFAVRNGRVVKSQQDLWARLRTLNAKREKIEQTIFESMMIIERCTANVASEIIAALEGRMVAIHPEQTPSVS